MELWPCYFTNRADATGLPRVGCDYHVTVSAISAGSELSVLVLPYLVILPTYLPTWLPRYYCAVPTRQSTPHGSGYNSNAGPGTSV